MSDMTRNEIMEAGFNSAMWFVERQIDEAYQRADRTECAVDKITAYRDADRLSAQWYTLKDFRNEATQACIKETLEALDNG